MSPRRDGAPVAKSVRRIDPPSLSAAPHEDVNSEAWEQAGTHAVGTNEAVARDSPQAVTKRIAVLDDRTPDGICDATVAPSRNARQTRFSCEFVAL
jgi:hypothetical protein